MAYGRLTESTGDDQVQQVNERQLQVDVGLVFQHCCQFADCREELEKLANDLKSLDLVDLMMI